MSPIVTSGLSEALRGAPMIESHLRSVPRSSNPSAQNPGNALLQTVSITLGTIAFLFILFGAAVFFKWWSVPILLLILVSFLGLVISAAEADL